MKTGKLTYLIIMFLVVIVIVLGITVYPDFSNQRLEDQPKLVGEIEKEGNESGNDLKQGSNSEVDNSEQGVEVRSIETMQSQVAHCEENFVSEPGWLHFSYKTISAVENGVILPDGSLMANEYFPDGWFLINQQGLVEAHVVRLIDDSGKPLQEEVFKDGKMVNLTTHDTLEDVQPYQLKMDLGFSTDMASMEKVGGNFSHELEDKLDIYTVTGKFDKPTVMSNSPLPVESITLSLVFDEEKKYFQEAERIWILSDGSEILFEKIEIDIVEKATIPDTIAQILENAS